MTRTFEQYPAEGAMVAGYAYEAPISFDPKYGWLASGSFPADCIAQCSAQGPVDSAVEYWRNRLHFAGAIEAVRPLTERYLREYGAWDDLTTADIDTLADRVLWTACCDIREQGEWLGLVHYSDWTAARRHASARRWSARLGGANLALTYPRRAR